METLVQLVEEVGARFDRRPALMIRPSFRTRTVRYRDLRATVPRVARVLVDEGDVSELAEDLAGDYPPIITSQLSGNVDVFAAEETTLYFAYALVTWTDGGLTSQHTIPIVLRFVGGEWRLSSLGQTAPGLTFVQSVEL